MILESPKYIDMSNHQSILKDTQRHEPHPGDENREIYSANNL